jgi:hypothetical protein
MNGVPFHKGTLYFFNTCFKNKYSDLFCFENRNDSTKC